MRSRGGAGDHSGPTGDAALPGAPAWVSGLINLRGTLLTVVDLAERLGVPGDGPTSGVRSVIVAEAGGKVFGIGVDEVRDVQAVPDGAIDPVEEARAAGGVVAGLVRLDAARGGGMALVCDVDAVAREALAF